MSRTMKEVSEELSTSHAKPLKKLGYGTAGMLAKEIQNACVYIDRASETLADQADGPDGVDKDTERHLRWVLSQLRLIENKL